MDSYHRAPGHLSVSVAVTQVTGAASWRWHTSTSSVIDPIKQLSCHSHISTGIHFCLQAHRRTRWQCCPPSFHHLWQLVPGDPKELYLIKMRAVLSLSLSDLQL